MLLASGVLWTRDFTRRFFLPAPSSPLPSLPHRLIRGPDAMNATPEPRMVMSREAVVYPETNGLLRPAPCKHEQSLPWSALDATSRPSESRAMNASRD